MLKAQEAPQRQSNGASCLIHTFTSSIGIDSSAAESPESSPKNDMGDIEGRPDTAGRGGMDGKADEPDSGWAMPAAALVVAGRESVRPVVVSSKACV